MYSQFSWDKVLNLASGQCAQYGCLFFCLPPLPHATPSPFSVHPGHIHLIPAPKAPVYPFQGIYLRTSLVSDSVYLPFKYQLKKIIQSSMSWFPTVKVSPIGLCFLFFFLTAFIMKCNHELYCVVFTFSRLEAP